VRQSSWSDAAVLRDGAAAILDAPIGGPTAVVCASDAAAMVVLREARARGLRTPADLSVTGFTNSALSAFVDPPLTTVEQPFYQMGHTAALHLVERAESSEPAPPGREPVQLPTRLVVRESTARCP